MLLASRELTIFEVLMITDIWLVGCFVLWLGCVADIVCAISFELWNVQQ